MKDIHYILSFALRLDQMLVRISGNELPWNQGTCSGLLHTVSESGCWCETWSQYLKHYWISARQIIYAPA